MAGLLEGAVLLERRKEMQLFYIAKNVQEAGKVERKDMILL
jgi:hypothetical protein